MYTTDPWELRFQSEFCPQCMVLVVWSMIQYSMRLFIRELYWWAWVSYEDVVYCDMILLIYVVFDSWRDRRNNQCHLPIGNMTTAARPTFEPARGGQGRGEKDLSAISRQYSSRDLPSHNKLKYRYTIILLTYFTGTYMHGCTTADTPQEWLCCIYLRDFEPFACLYVQHTWTNIYTCICEIIPTKKVVVYADFLCDSSLGKLLRRS